MLAGEGGGWRRGRVWAMSSINNISFQLNDAVAAGWLRSNAKRIINLPAYKQLWDGNERGDREERERERE